MFLEVNIEQTNGDELNQFKKRHFFPYCTIEYLWIMIWKKEGPSHQKRTERLLSIKQFIHEKEINHFNAFDRGNNKTNVEAKRSVGFSFSFMHWMNKYFSSFFFVERYWLRRHFKERQNHIECYISI